MSRTLWTPHLDNRVAEYAQHAGLTADVWPASGAWAWQICRGDEQVAAGSCALKLQARLTAESVLRTDARQVQALTRALALWGASLQVAGRSYPHPWRCDCGATGAGWRLAPHEAQPGPDGVFRRECARCFAETTQP